MKARSFPLSLSITIILWLVSGALSVSFAGSEVIISPDDSDIVYSGRIDVSEPQTPKFGWSGVRIRMNFTGTSVALLMDSLPNGGDNYFRVLVDGRLQPKLKVEGVGNRYILAENLDDSRHLLEIIKVTECFQGICVFKGFVLPTGGDSLPWPDTLKESRKIEFVGDSITCGYGVEVDDGDLHFSPETENFCLGYAYLTADALEADYQVVARSGTGMLRNYNGPREGDTGNNMPAIYPRIFHDRETPLWDYSRFQPDLVCINLGTNDFSTTGPNQDLYRENYRQFLANLRLQYGAVQIVVLMGPMDNSEALKTILTGLVEELNEKGEDKIAFFEMSAQGQFGFGADYHPNRKQAGINAGELTDFLKKLMGWN